MSRYTAPVLERPRFLPGVKVESVARPVVEQVDEVEQRIRELTAEGLSMRAVQPRPCRGLAKWGEGL